MKSRLFKDVFAFRYWKAGLQCITAFLFWGALGGGTFGQLTAEDLFAGNAVVRPGEVPRLELPPDAPQGVVKKLSFSDSRIFPGTVREVSVFIPAQYDSSRPACVYLRQDGYRPIEKELLEGLIAGGYMPVTVGVFVSPGTVPAPGGNMFGRRNRSFEYDGLGDSLARFYLEEILPFVIRELKLNLSESGNDRCIAGGSSGGIAAFNAAWERPEAFSRVYLASGSFTAFRGGYELPVLVRKTEAKPLRIYHSTGTRDMENCAGDWFLLDQEMDKALSFAGYDSKFRIVEGGHGIGFYSCFTEGMAFVWKDWPKPIHAGPSAPRVQDVIISGEPWQPVELKDCYDVRVAACNAAGEVFFTDAQNDKIYRIGLDGCVTEFLSDADYVNGITVGPLGNIYTVSERTGNVMCCAPDGKSRRVVSGLRGHSIQADSKGGLYITCSGEVWYVKDGSKTQVDSGLKKAGGLALRPDQWLLSVADSASKWVYSCQINSDGTLTNKEHFFWLHVPDGEDDAGAESVCYAKEGQMLVATRMGIQICADDGATQVILPMPDHGRVSSVCLGGRDGNTLFAFCGDRIWRRNVKIHAFGSFSTAVKIHASPL